MHSTHHAPPSNLCLPLLPEHRVPLDLCSLPPPLPSPFSPFFPLPNVPLCVCVIRRVMRLRVSLPVCVCVVRVRVRTPVRPLIRGTRRTAPGKLQALLATGRRRYPPPPHTHLPPASAAVLRIQFPLHRLPPDGRPAVVCTLVRVCRSDGKVWFGEEYSTRCLS